MNKPRETWPRPCKQAGLLLSLLLAPGAACADIPRWLPNPNDDPQLGDATPGERFGAALALDGDRLAVSAIEGYDSAGVRSGRVRVFRKAGSGWGPHTDVELPAGQQGARFGVGLALQGDTLVVGAPGVDRVGLLDLGAVQVYAYDGMRFQPQQLITDANGASLYFGTTIALDGESLAISRTAARRWTLSAAC